MTALGIIFGLLPGFVWLLFYLKEDLHPEPKRLIAFTFLAGIASAFYALIVQEILDTSLEPFSLGTRSLLSLVLFAFVEELFKFGAAYMSVHKNPSFNEPVDAMIYAIVAALGFATLENIGAVNIRDQSQLASAQSIFEVASLRFVGATLLHSLTAGIMGYFWAISIRDFGARRFLLYGMGIATLLHVVFNYLIIQFGTIIYSVVLLALAGFFVLNDFEKLRKRAI